MRLYDNHVYIYNIISLWGSTFFETNPSQWRANVFQLTTYISHEGIHGVMRHYWIAGPSACKEYIRNKLKSNQNDMAMGQNMSKPSILHFLHLKHPKNEENPWTSSSLGPIRDVCWPSQIPKPRSFRDPLVSDPEGQTPQWSAMAPSARCTVLAPRDRTGAQLPKKAKMAQEKC
jgi:hypothetical protein